MHVFDTIVVGAGAAGLAAACKLIDGGQKVLVLEVALASINYFFIFKLHSGTRSNWWTG